MSTAVRRSVTSTRHRPVRGSTAAKRLAVPHRLYSSSTRDGLPGVAGTGTRVCSSNLLAGLVETDLRPHGVIGSVVDLQDVLHGLHERSVFLGRNAEALYKPRLRLVFFRPRWTVLGLTESKTLSSTSRSARSVIVHRARPFGGGLQAIWTSCASDAPSSFRGREGLSWGLRSRVASTPRSQQRLRTRSTVTSPASRSSAISWSVSPS